MRNFFFVLVVLLLATFFRSQAQPVSIPDSWEETYHNKKGTIVVYWYTSRPFIFQDNSGEMAGIEVEILEGFQRYLKKAYKIDLTIEWRKCESFVNTYETIRNSNLSGTFGASVFSITPQRQKEVNFAPPYMSDITVMISSYNIPIVRDAREFKEVFSQLKAITIEGTTYERDLEYLKNTNKADFTIEYIPSSDNILHTIEQQDNAFGFIDLPIYMTEFNRNSAVRVKRQNLYPIKRQGYSIILPLGSDWQTPVEEYFINSSFEKEAETIIGRYLDADVYRFMKNLYTEASDEEVILLTKEKEIQNRALQGKSEEIKRETNVRNFFIAGFIIILIFLLIIYRMYRIRTKTAMLLGEQKLQIELQRLDIESQKMELERRNKRLVDLNEEKNHLIKILAHDLRTPINHITGLTQLIKMDGETLTENQTELLDKIKDAAIRLNGMISKILDVDAIESNRVNLKTEEIDVGDHLQKVVSGFEKAAAKKNIKLTFSATGENPRLHTDALYLTQVVENLISNALKFSPTGKAVRVMLKSLNGEIEICVHDQGPGFTDDDKTKLFSKFQQLSAKPTGNEQSTGLGLSIVKKYVDLMKGEVWCESQVGNGAAFFVRLQRS